MSKKNPDYMQCENCLRIVIEFQMKTKTVCHICNKETN